MLKEIIKNESKEVITKAEEILNKYGQTMINEVGSRSKVTLSVLTQGSDIKDIIVNNKEQANKVYEAITNTLDDDVAWVGYKLHHIGTTYKEKELAGNDSIQLILKDQEIDNVYINDYKTAWSEFTTRKQEDEWNRLAFREFEIKAF